MVAVVLTCLFDDFLPIKIRIGIDERGDGAAAANHNKKA